MKFKIKHILLIFFFVFKGAFTMHSQDYMDLLLLFVDENYKVCFSKSMKYTVKEKTKKDPLPYLYVAMSSYEMSQDHKYTNLYPKAYKTAISYISKYRKKDKEYKYKSDASGFIDKFKLVIMEDIENYIMNKTESSYSKASGLAKKMCSIDPDDYGLKLLYAHLCNLNKDQSTGKEYFKISKAKLIEMSEKKYDLKNLSKSQQYILRFSLIQSAYFHKEKKPSLAKEIIELGKHFFYDKNNGSKIEFSEEYKTLYDKL